MKGGRKTEDGARSATGWLAGWWSIGGGRARGMQTSRHMSCTAALCNARTLSLSLALMYPAVPRARFVRGCSALARHARGDRARAP